MRAPHLQYLPRHALDRLHVQVLVQVAVLAQVAAGEQLGYEVDRLSLQWQPRQGRRRIGWSTSSPQAQRTCNPAVQRAG
jgi:hypothetical protein